MNIWFLVFFVTPFLEIYVLISMGTLFGVWPTVIMVMITAVIGVSLLRQQGLSTLSRGMQKMQLGELPAQELAEGMLLAIAGALLLTPGFVTDAIGFALLTPVLRARLVTRIEKKVTASAFSSDTVQSDSFQADDVRSNNGRQGHDSSKNQVIEGEFERRP